MIRVWLVSVLAQTHFVLNGRFRGYRDEGTGGGPIRSPSRPSRLPRVVHIRTYPLPSYRFLNLEGDIGLCPQVIAIAAPW